MVHLLLAVIYISFISLGLPDSLLGSAWPTMYPQFQVPVSYAGIISMIISAGTIVSSLQSDRLTKRFGTGKVTACSVAMTAVAMYGFSVSDSFWQICLWGIPYGLGAGSVDASLNNYVALHYASRHMSWLHCMWGLGAATGPYIMGYALNHQKGWFMGYRYIALLQICLTVILIFSLPLWKGRNGAAGSNGKEHEKPLSIREILNIRGAKYVLVTFFGYCALEATAMLWSSSYLALGRGLSEQAAAEYASLFFLGITVGRAASGFLTMKFSDVTMIRMGIGLIAVGIAALFLPFGNMAAYAGLVIVGLGCAPIYPCIIHSTPERFGAENSQALVGVQMASAYVGSCLMPPVFGLLANHVSIKLFPVWMLVILILMFVMHEKLVQVTVKR